VARGLDDVRGLSFRHLVVGLLFGAIALTACLMPAQSDTYWHLRAGQDLWQTHAVTLVERYSHTAAGRFWPNHEWLWQAASYAVHRAGGFPLLVAAGAALVTLAYALAYRLMAGPPMTRFVLMVLGVPLGASVWALRPQIASLALLATLLTLIVRGPLYWIPPLFVLWANVHGAVAMGGLVLAALAGVAIVRARGGDADDRRRARTLALLVPVCALATAATPLGFRLWSFIGESMARSRRIGIDEWQPAYPTKPMEIFFWVLALAFVALLVRRRRALRTAAWGDQALIAAAVVMLPLAIRAGRNIAPFLLVAIPAASRLFIEGRERASPPATDKPRLNLAIAIACAAVGLVAVASAWSDPLPRLGWRPIGGAAIAAVRACKGPLYNRYNEGGYLIWLAPDRPVFLDSRQDPYPAELVEEALRVEERGDYAATFARFGVRCAFLPDDSPTRARLVRDGWETRFSDEKWAVLAAPGMP
jgi:hypothetical protein